MPTPEEIGQIEVALACPECGWSGTVRLYDIGDGPEWCCPGCDMCFPSNAVRGEDGLTVAERRLRELGEAMWQERYGS